MKKTSSLKRGLFLAAIIGWGMGACDRVTAEPVWVNVSGGLDELDIHSLAVHPRDGRIIFAASKQRLYQTTDDGRSWKQVFSTRSSSNTLRFVDWDEETARVYVGTDRGVEVSSDGGKHWGNFFKSIGEKSNSVYDIENSPARPDLFYVATADGLFQFDGASNRSKKVSEIPSAPVYSLLFDKAANRFLAMTEAGIYGQKGDGWEKLYGLSPETSDPAEGSSLGQFDIEELALPARFPNLIFSSSNDKFYAATPRGLVEGAHHGASWTAPAAQNFPPRGIRAMAKSPRTFYVATDTGVYEWDPKAEKFKEIYKGLDSLRIQDIFYSESGDYLLAGTTKGVFRLAHPELELFLDPQKPETPLSAENILDRFKNEPTILEIQNAAIRYAEVHFDKIKNWREAAARRALLPNLSLNRSINTDQNVDIDRGGTGDPDKFISGPTEKSFDWSVGFSWNLGDLIWNDDQTSIDTRSRLMVELRDEVLSQVTHFYYERRRLEVEMALSPPRDLSVQIEKEIRLEELTANIDALTGGYLSKRLTAKS